MLWKPQILILSFNNMPTGSASRLSPSSINLYHLYLHRICKYNFVQSCFFYTFAADSVSPKGERGLHLLVKDVYGRYLPTSNFATLKPFREKRQQERLRWVYYISINIIYSISYAV